MTPVIHDDPRRQSESICDGRTSMSFAGARSGTWAADLLGWSCRPNVRWTGREADFNDRRGRKDRRHVACCFYSWAPPCAGPRPVPSPTVVALATDLFVPP